MNWARLPWIGSEARIERQAIRWLAEMSDDPGGHREGLERWLTGDSRRRIVYARLAHRLNDLTRAAATLDREPVAVPPAPRPRHGSLLPALAACLSLGLCGLLALHVAEKNPPLTPLAPGDNPGSHFATTPGKRSAIRLADGSSVLLDGDSALAVHFSAGRRDLTLLRGRARFTVAHDKQRPFVVAASDGTVTATGTLFDVWIRPDRQVRVTLLRGRVEVRRKDATSTASAISLEPGQHLFYPAIAKSPATMTAPVPAPSSDAGWTTETIDFDYAPLSEVLLEANRHAARPIVLADPKLGTIAVFGTFRMDNPDRLAAALARSLDLDLRRSSTGVILAARPTSSS